MKYYLVALFDSDSNKAIESVQKNIYRKYKIHKSHPTLHIPLEVVDNVEFDELNKIIEKTIKPYKKFKIEVTNNLYYDNNHKCMSIKIENKGYIKKISRCLNDMFKLHGFSIRENSAQKTLYISLANLNYAPKELKNSDQSVQLNTIKGCTVGNTLKIDRIELWRSSYNKRENLIKSYVLKSF